MKRIFVITMVLVMLILLFPISSVSAVISGDFWYTIFENDPYRGTHIVKYTGTAEDVIIPATIDGHNVTGIGNPLWTSGSIFEKMI